MKRPSLPKSSAESGTSAGWLVALILLGGLAVRVAIAPWGGHPGDLPALLRWADALTDRGYLNVYASSDANYPPLALALLGFSGWLADLAGAGSGSPARIALLKLPAILADMGIGWLIWRRERRIAALAGVVFNPALIYLSAWWGQLESVYMLGALASVCAALEGRLFLAGLWLGLGMMVKLQAAAIAPIVILMILVGDRDRGGLLLFPTSPPDLLSARRRGGVERSETGVRPVAADTLRRLLKWCAGVLLALMLALGPFALTGQIGLVTARMVALVAAPGWLTVNALNFWYLASGGVGNWAFNAPLVWADTAPLIGGVSARVIGLGLMGLWAVGVLALTIRRLRDPSGRADAGRMVLLGGAMLYMGTFLWPTQSHERYAFGAVILLAAEAVKGSRLWTLYMAVSALHMLNLVWAAPFHPTLAGWLAGNAAVGLAAAIGMIGCAGWGAWMLGRGDFFTRN